MFRFPSRIESVLRSFANRAVIRRHKLKKSERAILLMLVVGSTVSLATLTSLPATLRAALQHPNSFISGESTSAIPASVRSAFARMVGDNSFSMAEPMAPWQATDVVSKPALPRRRLERVARSKSFCILFYELGGVGTSHHIVAFQFVGEHVKLAWDGTSLRAIDGPAGLLKAIDKGVVRDSSGYF